MNLGPNPDIESVYYLCPDSKCTGFTDDKFLCPRCPRKAKRAVVCWSCKKVIVVRHDYSAMCRIDCTCGASVFTLMAPVSCRHNLHLKRLRPTHKVSAPL